MTKVTQQYRNIPAGILTIVIRLTQHGGVGMLDATKDPNKSKYTDWKDFDADAYAGAYFASNMPFEDQYILKYILKTLREMDMPLETWTKVADIGAGPNLYPGMSLAPFVKPASKGGRIDLHDYSPGNIEYLKAVMGKKHQHAQPGDCWSRIEKMMEKESHHWKDAFEHVRSRAKIIAGDLFAIEKHAYDAVVAVFVAESMTDKMTVCEMATRHILDTVKPGGFTAMGFMLGSQGYPAGKNTLFPAVAIELEDVQRMFKDQKNINVIRVPGEAHMRPGYTGVALAIGTKT